MTQAVQVTGVVCEHGGGPVWSPAWPGLRWVDMLAGDVLALAPDGCVTAGTSPPCWPRSGPGPAAGWPSRWSGSSRWPTRTAYYVDSPTRRVDAFDYQPDPGLSGRRPAIDLDGAAGVPDGLTIDADGYLWVAMHGGSAVRRYRPDGRLDGQVELPVSQVTACTFGAPPARSAVHHDLPAGPGPGRRGRGGGAVPGRRGGGRPAGHPLRRLIAEGKR